MSDSVLSAYSFRGGFLLHHTNEEVLPHKSWVIDQKRANNLKAIFILWSLILREVMTRMNVQRVRMLRIH